MKVLVAVLWVFLLGAAPAWAVLGQSVVSVRSDQLHIEGELRTFALQGYAVHKINRGDGTVVKEYVSPAGMVFGVSWQGPTVPDLSLLLGSYFAQFQQAAQTASHRRQALRVRTGELVVESSGHLRAFRGRAYVPSLLPNNLSEAVVK
jgi:hypothetical protein